MCKHGGEPISTVAPDDRQRETYSQRTKCPFKVVYHHSAQQDIAKVTNFSLEHTCVPRPLERREHVEELKQLPARAEDRAITIYNCGGSMALVRNILMQEFKITTTDNVLRSIRCKIENSVKSGKRQ